MAQNHIMFAPKSAAKCKKNFVKDAAKIQINKQATKKQYTPGVYAQHHPSQCEHMLRNRPIHLKQERATDGKEMLKIVMQDNIRELLVPSHNINVYPTIWQSNELGRINAAGKIVTREDRLQRANDLDAEKRRKELECEQRKHVLKSIDKNRVPMQPISNGDDGEDVNVQILNRAFVAKQEQTEEVQRANRLILATKCHVIRDAQVAEKNEIKQEMRDEELRLEKMMLEERARALQLEDVRRDELRRNNAKHAHEIKNQLREREMAKVMEAERIEEEAKAMAKAQIAITMDMLEKERDRKEQKLRVRTELQKSNELNEFFKGLVFEEQRIADMKAQEFMRIKQAREQQLVLDKKLAAEQKQREADRLLVLQTKMLNTKDAQEEMNMRRNQEEKEREFRQREKVAAIKKKKIERELEQTRHAQMEEIKRTRALNVVREEMDFQNVVSKLKADEEKDKQLEEEKYRRREKYRSEIINQINEKEMARRDTKDVDRSAFRAEQEKELQRTNNIRAVINNKIAAMRRANIPEKLIKDVERQLYMEQKLTK